MRLSICIIDEEAIRAETIRETLLDEDYDVETFPSADFGLKAVAEGRFDVVFVDPDVADIPVEYVAKIKKFSPSSHIVALISGDRVDKVLMLAELGIKYYIETPVNSVNSILTEVAAIEADILNAEDKRSTFVSILEDSRMLAKGVADKNEELNKRLVHNINIASKVLSPSTNAPGELKGNISEFPYYDIVRLVSMIYREGTLEIKKEKANALIITKNQFVVSAYCSPNIKGLKAFMRIAGWTDGVFTFRSRVISQYSIDTDLANIDVVELCSMARRISDWYALKRKNLPSDSLELGLNIRQLKKDIPLTPPELDVLSYVVEYSRVADILNYCKVLDSDILATLIGLRKKGMFELRV
ncbi:MAG: response regulator [Oligoflexia bacterium]|nr:response regulator [Oligoflexia bacterium]